MDKETFNMRRDWAKVNIDNCNKEIRVVKERILRLKEMLETLEKSKEEYREHLEETWERYIDQGRNEK